jgi:hypothetical protein
LLVGVVAVFQPAPSQASDFDAEPGRGMSAMTSWVNAVDVHGDKDGNSRYSKSESNRQYVKVNGKVTAISASSISVDVVKDGVTTAYTFTIDSATKIIRKFKGIASLTEVLVGDTVRVYVTSLTGGTAKLIWDKSIWWVTLSGKISVLNATDKTFSLVITRKEPQTGLPMTLTVPIKANDATTYWQASTAKAFTDLANDQTVNVRGSWNAVVKVVVAGKVTIKS